MNQESADRTNDPETNATKAMSVMHTQKDKSVGKPAVVPELAIEVNNTGNDTGSNVKQGVEQSIAEIAGNDESATTISESTTKSKILTVHQRSRPQWREHQHRTHQSRRRGKIS